MRFRKLLCVTDLTEESDLAMREADSLARRQNAALTILCALPVRDSWSALFPFLEHKAATTDKLRVISDLANRVAEHAARVTGRKSEEFEVVVETGRADTVTVAKAEQMQCDLIVISADDFMARIVRHAHCPVFVVRKSPGAGVLAATDLSDPSLPELNAAKDEALSTHEQLTAMFSLDLAELTSLGPPTVAGAYLFGQAEVEVALCSATAHLREAMEQVNASGLAVVERGAPADAILRIASRLRSRLIVLGAHGKSLLRSLLNGNVAEVVAQHACCSVLIMRLSSNGRERMA